MIGKIKNKCSVNKIWLEQQFGCAELIEHPYASELPIQIMNDVQFDLLKVKQILDASRFLPFRKNMYSGPLYIIQDKYSASATEGFTSLLQQNNEAIIVGENSYGAGCGYTNGGIQVELKNLGLLVKMPDCSRYRKDGKNEIYGIEPDLPIYWNKNDSEHTKGQKVYLTFDIDCLDPAFAPGTGTPVSGGLSSGHALAVLNRLRGLEIVGSDVVEVSPPYDHSDITAIAGGTVAVYMLGLLHNRKFKNEK